MTVIIVPFSALTADMTVDPHERSVLSAFRMVFAVAGTLAAAAATRPLVVLLGGGGIAGEVKGFRIVGVLYGAVLALAVLVTFALIRERTHTDRDARFSLRDDLKVVLHNRPFIILTLGVMMHQTALNTMSTVVVYFFKYNLRAEAMIPVAFLCLMVSSVASIPFFLWLSKTRGKKYSYNLGMGILAAFAVPIYLYADRSMAAALAFFFVVGLGIGTTYLSPWSMIPDTVEYSQWKTGLRREGTLYGVFYFSYKLSVAVPGLLVGAVLKMSGYVPNSAQGPGALLGIKALLTVVPMVFVIAGIVLISRFPITDELHRRMVREIRERTARP
jgi:GPH family glycoside/pentoside/hexuronide:cation symporter